MKPRGFKIAAAGLTGLILILAGLYLVMNREKKDLTPEARSGLPGYFIPLTGGVTHAQVSGPEAGQVVLLVHGFSIPSYVWENNVAALAQAGFRVVTFDLYGRGYSDRSPTDYTLDLFVRQVNDLLDELQISRPVD